MLSNYVQIQQLAWQLVHRLDQVFPDVTKSDVVGLLKQYMKHKGIYKDITVKQKNKYTYLQDVQSILNVPLYTKFHFRDSKIKSQYVNMQYGLCGVQHINLQMSLERSWNMSPDYHAPTVKHSLR